MPFVVAKESVQLSMSPFTDLESRSSESRSPELDSLISQVYRAYTSFNSCKQTDPHIHLGLLRWSDLASDETGRRAGRGQIGGGPPNESALVSFFGLPWRP